ncbi:hypothetical protein J2W97_001971 [Paenibacillus jamilae]|nr:hypothetical protein [Paenibacillus jamilae]
MAWRSNRSLQMWRMAYNVSGSAIRPHFLT